MRHVAAAGFFKCLLEVAALTALAMVILFLMRRPERKALCVLFILLSIFIRARYSYYHDNYVDPMYRKTENGAYTFKPGYVFENFYFAKRGDAVKIDEDGFRRCPYSKTINAPAISLIGDSWIFGWKLSENDTLCALLGDELSRRGAGKFRIINQGIPGLNFSSYARIADAYSKKNNPEWIFIGYLSYRKAADGADTDPFDMLYFAAEGREHLYYRLMVALFGRETVKDMHQLYDRFDRRTPPGARTLKRMEKEISALEKAAKKSRIVILCFFGPDEFTDALKQRIQTIKVVDFSVPYDYTKGYVFKDDPHPTAKANRLFARRMADIMAREK